MTDRIRQFIDHQGISIRSFEQTIHASNGLIRKAITNGTDIQSKWITAIAGNFPQLDIEWLLTGKGVMLKEAIAPIQVLYKPVGTEMKLEEQGVLLYDVSAAANLKTLFSNKDQNILGKINIPDMPKCDGAVYVRGDSMYPLLKSGDIIAYKEVHNFSYVIYGEMYLISFMLDGDEFLTVKYVNKSELDNHIKLTSYNTHHEPMDIPGPSINAMALVKFSIRKNTML